MGTIGVIVTIATFIGLLWLFWKKIQGFFSRHIFHSDISMVREEGERFGIANVRLAYAGDSTLIIDKVRFRTSLTIPRRNQIKLWILLTLAYLKGDSQSISAVNGPLLPRRRWQKHLLLFVIGLLKSIMVILFTVYPIFLIGILVLGPPEELKVVLAADDSDIDIKDVNANIKCLRPFLIEPKSTRNLIMRYEARPKKQFGITTTFFRSNVLVSYVDDTDGNRSLKWQLPGVGQLVWEAKEYLHVQIKGRLTWYSVNEEKERRKFVTIKSI